MAEPHVDIAEARALRNTRIDSLSVDRAHLGRYPLPIMSPEMARREQRLERKYGCGTPRPWSERTAAWRKFLKT